MDINVKKIGTLRTNSVGAAISIGIGFLVAGVCLSAFLLFTGLSFENWWWLPTITPGFLSAGWFFDKGHRNAIATGFVGVMTFLDQRIEDRVLSEGRHWLIPWFTSFVPVDARKKTIHIEDVSALSTDDVKMTGDGIITYQIGDPDVMLSVDDPILAITRFGKSEYRNAISGKESQDLEKPETKNELAAQLLARLKVKGEELGMNVTNFTIPEIMPPEKIADAAAELRVEKEETKAETEELDHVIVGIDKLVAKGMTVDLAAETVQVERGKGTRVVHVHRLAGLDGITASIVGAITTALSKEGTATTKEEPKT